MDIKDVVQGYINISNSDFRQKAKSWKDDEELVSILMENGSNFDVEEYINDLHFMMGHQGMDAFSEMKHILRQEIEMKKWIKEYGPFTL